ncbi:MAG: hypothetical protein FWE64_02370 [Alphaproteobacteria bacterium]|nr:hypothetical protein [Alphaproteobacteria bacterium]
MVRHQVRKPGDTRWACIMPEQCDEFDGYIAPLAGAEECESSNWISAAYARSFNSAIHMRLTNEAGRFYHVCTWGCRAGDDLATCHPLDLFEWGGQGRDDNARCVRCPENMGPIENRAQWQQHGRCGRGTPYSREDIQRCWTCTDFNPLIECIKGNRNACPPEERLAR